MKPEAERLARLYVGLGWRLLPIRSSDKIPAGKWRHRKTPADLSEVLGWLSRGHGLGVALGPVSDGLVARDFDDASAYDRWATEHQDLADRLPTSRTHRGAHVFARTAEPVRPLNFDDGELRSDGQFVVIPPTIHPSGTAYRWQREPSPHPATDTLSVTDLAAAGLDRCWAAGDAATSAPVTERAEITYEMASVVSAVSASSVLSVTPEQHEAVLQAVEETVPAGVGRRNDGVFRFARKLRAILGGIPSTAIIERYGMIWYEAAAGTIGTLDPGVTIADLKHAIRRVKKPDDGSDMLESVMQRAMQRPAPSFVAHLPDEAPSVKLAKLIVELDAISDHDVFYLSCHRAGALVGLAHRQAYRLLMAWVDDGVLRLVERGTPGRAGGKANRYQLLTKE